MIQVGGCELSREHVVRDRPTIGEQIRGHLSGQHAHVGDALARHGFFDVVEGPDPIGREQEQIRHLAAAQRKGVTELCSIGGDRRDGV